MTLFCMLALAMDQATEQLPLL